MDSVYCPLSIGIFGHMIKSDSEVSSDQWETIEDSLADYAKQIEQLWHAAFKQHGEERTAHEEALEAVEAEKAAPGSAETSETPS
jgi:hypothetical protein